MGIIIIIIIISIIRQASPSAGESHHLIIIIITYIRQESNRHDIEKAAISQIFINWAPSVSSLRSITIIIITRSSSSIISIITSLTITKLTSSWSSSSASSSSPTAEPKQNDLLVWLPLGHQQSSHQIPTSHQPCSSQPGPGGNSSPWPPWPRPMQKGAITKTIDLSRKWPHPHPPTPKAWFIKDCGVQPPLILLTKGKLSWLRPAFVISQYKHILLNKHVSLVLRLKLFEAMVSPAMPFGLATLPLTKGCLQKLGVVQTRMFRSIVVWVRIHDDLTWRDIMVQMNHKLAIAKTLFPNGGLGRQTLPIEVSTCTSDCTLTWRMAG